MKCAPIKNAKNLRYFSCQHVRALSHCTAFRFQAPCSPPQKKMGGGRTEATEMRPLLFLNEKTKQK